jgi:hypothetical protein
MLWLSCSLFNFFLFGCNDSDNVIDSQIDKLDFQIVFLDENKNENVVFAEDFDVRIAVKIINNSQTETEWRYDYTCMMLQTQDFLVVYKKNETNETSADYSQVGRPYETPLNCYTFNLPPQGILPGQSILINLPWSTNPSNKSLASGKYYSTAKFSLEINNNTKNWDLRNDFEIK